MGLRLPPKSQPVWKRKVQLASKYMAGSYRGIFLQETGGSGERRERSDEKEKEGRRDRQGVDREPHGPGSLRPARLRCRLLEEHVADDAEVVGDGEGGVDDQGADDRVDEHGAGLDPREDDPGLAEEAAEGRYADERGHKDPHGEGEGGAGAEEAVEALCVLADEVYREEGSHVHEGVSGGVDQDRFDRRGNRLSLQGGEGREDVSRVGHRAVGEHPAHVALPQGEEIADEQRDNRQHRHEGGPDRRRFGHPLEEYAQEDGEERGLRRYG